MRRIRKAPQEPSQSAPVLIGYARVSTSEQDLTAQIEALRKHGVLDQHLYSDKQSGKTMRRRGLEDALLDARPGDVLVVYKLDRLSRSMKDLLYLSERLHDDGIELRSLNDPVDTTSPMGKFYFHLMAALAEFERSLIGWRTKKGMESARDRGQRFGPTSKIGKRELREVARMLKAGQSAETVGKRFGLTGQRIRQIVLAEYGKPLWKPKPRKRK